jgi:lysophospholipase L1-like esterase
VRYVALGDSYTIGNAVSRGERWPDQLVAMLAAEALAAGREPPLELVGNLATSDFTTRDVIAVELPQLESLRPEVCSLLIGTNDVVQLVDEDEYGPNLEAILDAIEAIVGRGRTFGVTTADFTVTPFGRDYGDPRLFSAQLRARNQIFANVLGSRGVPVADVYDLSLDAARDPTLVAADDLHPSGRQYTLWLARIVPVVRELLGAA